MSKHNMPPVAKSPELEGRNLFISRMGRAAFILEQGPNASHKNPNNVAERSLVEAQRIEENQELNEPVIHF